MGFPVNSLGKVVRSVRAFGRELARVASAGAPPPTPKIGLALGGGFARGMAHIGVLKVLEQEGIPIAQIAGTSVGALIGAIYCSGVCAAEMEEIACRVRMRDFARWTISRFGLATNQRMTIFLNGVLKVRNFEDLRIPLAVTATDFRTGEGVIFRSGPLIDSVRASCAYPGMFLPVDIGGRLLVDGMLSHAVPAQPLRELGMQRVIAVSLKSSWTGGEAPRHLFDVIGQCFAIAQEKDSQRWRRAAHVVVEPDMDGFRYDDFSRSPELIRAGELAMRQALPRVRKWMTQPAAAAIAPLRLSPELRVSTTK